MDQKMPFFSAVQKYKSVTNYSIFIGSSAAFQIIFEAFYSFH